MVDSINSKLLLLLLCIIGSKLLIPSPFTSIHCGIALFLDFIFITLLLKDPRENSYYFFSSIKIPLILTFIIINIQIAELLYTVPLLYWRKTRWKWVPNCVKKNLRNIFIVNVTLVSMYYLCYAPHLGKYYLFVRPPSFCVYSVERLDS